jgi:hypothetical protein
VHELQSRDPANRVNFVTGSFRLFMTVISILLLQQGVYTSHIHSTEEPEENILRKSHISQEFQRVSVKLKRLSEMRAERRTAFPMSAVKWISFMCNLFRL